MGESKITDEWINRLLGSSRESIYHEGYQRSIKWCKNIGTDDYYASYFAEGFVQGHAEQRLLIICQCTKDMGIPFTEVARTFQITESELENLYMELVSENTMNNL